MSSLPYFKCCSCDSNACTQSCFAKVEHLMTTTLYGVKLSLADVLSNIASHANLRCSDFSDWTVDEIIDFVKEQPDFHDKIDFVCQLERACQYWLPYVDCCCDSNGCTRSCFAEVEHLMTTTEYGEKLSLADVLSNISSHTNLRYSKFSGRTIDQCIALVKKQPDFHGKKEIIGQLKRVDLNSFL